MHFLLFFLFLCLSALRAFATPAATQAAQNSTVITHESYTDFLKTVAGVDPCHFFEEKGGEIMRFGKVGSYDYLATTEERGATPGYFINAPFMNAFEAECYCAWKNRAPQGAKEYAHDQISWLDSYHGHQNDLKDLNDSPSKHDTAASPCAHPLYTIEIQGRSMTQVDPLLKSNLLTYQLKTDQDQLLKTTAGEEEVVSEVVNSVLDEIIEASVLLASGLAGISTSALHSSSGYYQRSPSLAPHTHDHTLNRESLAGYEQIHDSCSTSSSNVVDSNSSHLESQSPNSRSRSNSSDSNNTYYLFERTRSDSSSTITSTQVFIPGLQAFNNGTSPQRQQDESRSSPSSITTCESLNSSPESVRSDTATLPNFDQKIKEATQHTAHKKEIVQDSIMARAAKQAFTSVLEELLQKTLKQTHAWTTVQGPTEAMSPTSNTPEYNSVLPECKRGGHVYPAKEYPAEEDPPKSTTNPLQRGTSDEISAPGTQTRPPYFNYPGFGVIGGIGMGVGALGLSGIPWIATYAEDQISYVTIGDAGNLPDPFAYPYEWGSVDYEFEMSTTPVTVVQWLAYLNTVARKEDPNHLWNDAMPIIRNGTQGRYSYSLKDPDKKNQPITHVSYTNAKSYCQWQSDTSGNSENTNSAITYDIPTPDEYLKAHFYNPQALQEIGGYEDAPCDVYGTEPPQENFYEWTRGADTEKKLFILSTSTTSPFNIEQIEPKIEREDLGFSVVKRTSLSFEQKNKKEKECLKKTQSYCEKKSQDITLLEDKNQLWSNAAVSLSNSIICLENSQQELLVSCKTAAAFYLASIQASLSSREFHKRETECWNNAGDYFVNYLTNEYPDHQQNYKEAIAYSTKSAIEYTFLNKYLAYNYAIAAYDAVKNFDSQTSIPTINKLTPFIKNKISIEK